MKVINKTRIRPPRMLRHRHNIHSRLIINKLHRHKTALIHHDILNHDHR
jgi:hypothetical protein